MRSIQIKHYQFTVSEPFAEGTVIDGPTATAINALRAENIRNNWAKRLAQELDKLPSGESLSPERLRELQAELTVYDARYRFAPRGGLGQRPAALAAEARAIAEERVAAQARQAGVEGLVPGSAEFEALVDGQAELPVVQAEARRRIAERRQLADETLEELL